MAYFVKFENADDFYWLRHMVEKWAAQCEANLGAFVEVADRHHRLRVVFESAIDAPYVTLPGEATVATQSKPAEAQPKKKKSSPGLIKVNLCKDHVYYSGQRRPRTSCAGCWDAYERMNPGRGAMARREFIRKHPEEE